MTKPTRRVAVPHVDNADLKSWLESAADRLDTLDGFRDAPLSKGVTIQDLKDIGLVGTVVKRGKATMSLKDRTRTDTANATGVGIDLSGAPLVYQSDWNDDQYEVVLYEPQTGGAKRLEGGTFAAIWDDENITGEWTFENVVTVDINLNGYQLRVDDVEVHETVPLRVTNYDGVLIENPDFAGAGIHITTQTGADPLNNGIGTQIAFWEVGDDAGSPFTPYSYGFRLRHSGEVDSEGNLDFYRHTNSTAGVLFMRFTRESSQVQFANGTAGAPILTHLGDTNTGIYWRVDDELNFSVAGAEKLHLTSVGIYPDVQVRNLQGTAAAPSYSFAAQVDTGWYYSTDGGVHNLHLSVFGVERYRFSASGQLGIGGANYGTAGQALLSGGALAAPAWTTISVDHGTQVTGLGDDDHTQYVLRSILTTDGDLFTRAAGVVSRIGVGTNGYVLKVVAGVPTWAVLGAGTGTVDTIGEGAAISVDATDAANPIVAIDINSLTADATPAGAADYVVTWDASASAHKKVLLDNLPGGGGGGTVDTVVAGVGIFVDATDTANPIVGLSPLSLADEILDDAPIAYWKLTESSVGSGATLADSSGNARSLTMSGTGQTAVSSIWPNAPVGETMIRWAGGATNYASRSDLCGMTAPLTGDYSLEAIFALPAGITVDAVLMAFMASGETEATNYQGAIWLEATGDFLSNFWESGAGVNQQTNSDVALVTAYRAYHAIIVKDGTANTVTFWLNGYSPPAESYATEPSGGSSAITYVGGDVTTEALPGTFLGHVAVYDTKLTNTRAMAHFRASGLIG